MLGTIWKRHPWVTAIFAVATIAVVVFAVRLAAFALYWADPAHRNQAIAGWMTPGYVAASWDVPKPVVMDALGFEERGKRQSLEALAEERGVPLRSLIEALEAAIDAHRQAQP